MGSRCPCSALQTNSCAVMNLGLQVCVSQLFTLNTTQSPGWSPSQVLLPTQPPPSMFRGLVSHFQQILPFQKVQYSTMPSPNHLHFQTIPYSRLISAPIRPVPKTHVQEHYTSVLRFSCALLLLRPTLACKKFSAFLLVSLSQANLFLFP